MQTSISGHIFDYVEVPEYSAKNPLHREVVTLAKQCHEVKASGQTGNLKSLEKNLDQVAAAVLTIPTGKLKVIQDELQRLRGIAPSSSEEGD
jgi:hypothetical protein